MVPSPEPVPKLKAARLAPVKTAALVSLAKGTIPPVASEFTAVSYAVSEAKAGGAQPASHSARESRRLKVEG